MPLFNTEYLAEAIALGVDTLILGLCLRQYFKTRNIIDNIQLAPNLEIDQSLQEIVESHPDKKINLVTIRGIVKPLGDPIVSQKNSSISGVLQLLSIKEHVIQRSTAGFWTDQERVIHEVYNIMPFVLHSNKSIEVEIIDPLAAEFLDLDVISDHFQPVVPSIVDHVWGFIAGIRQRGVQTTEKMLRTGSVVTGVGELIMTPSKKIRLQPPNNGLPFYLTNMQISSLLRKLNNRLSTYRMLCTALGAISIFIITYVLRRYLKERSKRMEAERIRKEIAKARQERRSRRQNNDSNDDHQLCVVCRDNPREIILLPCGHVCLCEDCSLNILDHCPLCRASIRNKSVAFIS